VELIENTLYLLWINKQNNIQLNDLLTFLNLKVEKKR